MEKTKHYLLLREKLESSMLMGQESLQCGASEDLCESPKPSEVDQEAGCSSEITTERQRELAAKVLHHSSSTNLFSVTPAVCSYMHLCFLWFCCSVCGCSPTPSTESTAMCVSAPAKAKYVSKMSAESLVSAQTTQHVSV